MSVSADPSTESSVSAPRDRWAPTTDDIQLGRWGGRAAVAGVIAMVATVAVVVGLGLPDASDVETLTDFADIETGRIFEHLFYLGALILFALHVLVLQRLLRAANPAAALFGSAIATFGYVIMAASSMLHLSTSPLAELYTSPETPQGDLTSIEYAWYGAQSVFDTMLITGVLLVSVGILLLGIAMRSAPAFSRSVAWTAVVLGGLGVVGTVVEIVDPSVESSAAGVLALVLFHLIVGLKTLTIGDRSITPADRVTIGAA